jgi:hypothetical protein
MSGRPRKAASRAASGNARPQHPRQMLNLPSTDLPRARAGARAEERRHSLRDKVAARRLILPRGVTPGETRLETIGAAEGTVGTEMFGGGGAGTLAALPTPLGSLAELLRPPALPGPLIPLTPASWAGDVAGAVRLAARTKAKNADLPNMRRLQRECTNESRGLAFLFCVSRHRCSRKGPDRDAAQDQRHGADQGSADRLPEKNG